MHSFEISCSHNGTHLRCFIPSRLWLEDLEFWLFGLFNRIFDLNTSSCDRIKTTHPNSSESTHPTPEIGSKRPDRTGTGPKRLGFSRFGVTESTRAASSKFAMKAPPYLVIANRFVRFTKLDSLLEDTLGY